MRAYVVTVGTTATRVCPTAAEVAVAGAPTWAGSVAQPASIHVKNTGATPIFIGGSDVNTTTAGFSLATGESVELDLQSDAVYAIVAAATETLAVLRTS